ncbi:hypothetical protein KJ359_003032 [Pestalotiopsis sp. 9143b]|nr:hypothetical protein KJ359_003032 [Pestalotiopsis sp. 9143b]
MSDANTTANANGKVWTPEEEFDLVMATLYQSNAFAAVPWEAVATMMQKKYPTKAKEACRQKFNKMKNAYLTKFEVDDVPAGPTKGKAKGTPKTPRKRVAAEDAAEDNEGEETPSAKKPRYQPAVKKSLLKRAAGKKQEVVDAPEEDPEEDMDV